MQLQMQIIMFIVMIIVGMAFNPMNILAYRFGDLFLSLTLFYGGILMASNMIWAHEIVHFLAMGHFSIQTFIIGVLMSITVSKLLLRNQLFVNEKQWLRRMISHHSTALTTSKNIKRISKNPEIQKLANDIIVVQEREIDQMKRMLIDKK